MTDLTVLMDCAHCGATLQCAGEPSEYDDQEVVLMEDSEYVCWACRGVNLVMIDGEEAYFRACDDPDCPACALAEAKEEID